MTGWSRWCLVAVSLGRAGCGGSSAAMAPRLLSVGGSYALTKTVLEDTCGGPVTAFTFAARVTHSPGAAAFVLNDSFNDLAGTVSADGAFAIPHLRTGTHQGAAVTSAFESGRFTANALDVRVRLEVDGPSGSPPFPACAVTEAWHGAKQGPPNVIP
jgi:hypothetical protein